MPDNLLLNAVFSDWSHLRTFPNGETWEQPRHWTVYVDPITEAQPHVPQFLHDPKGFKISSAYIKFLAGMRQRVFVEGGQRYVLKATLEPHVHQGTATTPPTPQSVEWRLQVSGEMEDDGAWSSLTTLQGSDNGQVRDVLWVIQPAYSGYVDVTFVARNTWGAGVSDLFLHYMGLEPVSSDYGGTGFTVIEPYMETPPVPTPTPVPTPPPQPTPEPGQINILFPSEVTVKVEIGANLLTLLLAMLQKQVNGVPDGQQTP